MTDFNLPDPMYTTAFGEAHVGDSLELMRAMPEESVNLVVTSPPYALEFKKSYGNVSKTEYVEWFLQFAREIYRILKPDGSFVLNIGGSWNKGTPTRSLYVYQLVIALVEEVNFHLAQEFFWYNPAKLPAPAEWVTVRRIRVKDSVEYVFWFSKTPWPKATNRNVLTEYSPDMLRLLKKGYQAKERPSGHNITDKFSRDQGGAIPGNLIESGNNDANSTYHTMCKQAGIKRHPARFPAALPDFFIRLLTDENDLVLDPFAGSNTTGATAERLERRWKAFELNEEYLFASQYRFVRFTQDHTGPSGIESLFTEDDEGSSKDANLQRTLF